MHLWECNDKKGDLFDENNDNEMKKIRIRSLTCRQLVYSKRSIKKTFEAKGWIKTKCRKDSHFQQGGVNRSLERWGGGKKTLDKVW